MSKSISPVLSALKARFWSSSPTNKKKKRYLWLFEIAIVAAIFSLCTPLFAIACKSIHQKRLKDLRSLQAQHLLSLIWYQVLQSRSLEQRGIVWESFDQKREIALPEITSFLKEGKSATPYGFSLSFERNVERDRFPYKRLILAKLTLWYRERSFKIKSERWLILQREI